MKIYISGPMSGMKDYNYPAFNQLAELLRANGHKVFNPAETTIPQGSEWVRFLKHDIALMMKADIVVLLSGWERSKGACLEVHIAKELDYRIIEESELVELGIIF